MGCEKCAQAILITLNVIFFIIGAAAVGVGIWVVVDGTKFLELLAKVPDTSLAGKLISDAAYILIAGGGAIFLVAFFGCCGAWKKNKCLLLTYAVIVALLVLIEAACVIVAALFFKDVQPLITSKLVPLLSKQYNSTFTPTADPAKYTYSSSDIISKGIDAIQLEFQCCGISNYTDYYNSHYPMTCCNTTSKGADLTTLVKTIWGGSGTITLASPTCPANVAEVENVKGCYDAIKSYVIEKSAIFIGICGGTLGLQVLVIIMSCCLFRAVQKEEHYA